MELSLADLLASPDEELQPEGERCLPALLNANITVLDEEHLLVRGRGERRWLNRLRGRCSGLRPDMILVTERTGSSRQCEFDTVYGARRGGFGGGGLGVASARCALGKFEAITPEHADVLVVAFEQQRRDLRAQRRQERRDKRAQKKQNKQQESQPAAESEPQQNQHDPAAETNLQATVQQETGDE